MRAAGKLRIAILAHSTNPRGGVVHAIQTAEALCDLGHDAVVHAPDVSMNGFFRPVRCGAISVPARPVAGGLRDLVDTRIEDFLRYFSEPTARAFDVFHAHDGIGGSALLHLREAGAIQAYGRTVHHLEHFNDGRVAELQRRSIVKADQLFVVSRMWREELRRRFDRSAIVVGNGVDLARFSKFADDSGAMLRAEYPLGDGKMFLAIGGVEERKNTVHILQAFAECRSSDPSLTLVIAGGASLLDHSSYRRRFDALHAALQLPAGALVITGPMPDRLMPALYRRADALVFPSVNEGFGLVALEAMASGVPVITSRIRPFTDYLNDADVLWCDPRNPKTIAAAMLAALVPATKARLAVRGPVVAAAHDWRSTAIACLGGYAALKETCNA